MATLSSRIHDLTTVIVNALNARASQAPASGYDIAKVNGYTGTQAQWLADFSDPGNTDYAAQFNSQLGAIPTAGIATEALVGTTQLATLAEALAGTNSAKALSALRSAGVRIATSLADLNTKAASLPDGSIIALPNQDYTASSNGIVYRSIWYVQGNYASALTPIIASNIAALNYLASICGNDVAGKTYPRITFDPYVTLAVIARYPAQAASNPFRDEYIWVGRTTGWLFWRGEGTVVAASNYAINNRYNRLRVEGEMTHISFSIQNNSGVTPAADNLIVTLATPYTTNNDLLFSGAATTPTNGWGPQAFFTRADGIHILGTPPNNGSATASSVFGAAVSWPRALPTA